jgi:hypothetical protein
MNWLNELFILTVAKERSWLLAFMSAAARRAASRRTAMAIVNMMILLEMFFFLSSTIISYALRIAYSAFFAFSAANFSCRSLFSMFDF